jgi:cytoskeletal protein CcmA (bactofilin family)
MASPEIDERRVTGWIGHGVAIEGRITSAQDLRIDGKVEGTIEVGDHGVTVGQSAEVKADLVVKWIVISGAVIGDVTATERVEIKQGASVEGDITTPRLLLAEGAVVNGSVDAAGTARQRDPLNEPVT